MAFNFAAAPACEELLARATGLLPEDMLAELRHPTHASVRSLMTAHALAAHWQEGGPSVTPKADALVELMLPDWFSSMPEDSEDAKTIGAICQHSLPTGSGLVVSGSTPCDLTPRQLAMRQPDSVHARACAAITYWLDRKAANHVPRSPEEAEYDQNMTGRIIVPDRLEVPLRAPGDQ